MLHRCSRCGDMYYFQEAITSSLRCNKCNGKPLLSSAPIFAADFPNRPPVPIRLSEAIKRISFDWNSNHCIFKRTPMQDGRRLPRDFIKGLKEAQHERPMDSLCWTCPSELRNQPCTWRDEHNFCTYSAYENRHWRDDRWGGTQRRRVTPPPATTASAFGVFTDRYRPVTLTEGVTKPIKISIHIFSDENALPMNFHRNELTGVSEIFFVRELEIFEFTIALAVGLPYISTRRRAVRLFEEDTSDGEQRLYVLSRRLITEGIVIRLNSNEVRETLEDWRPRRPRINENALSSILYHTVSHAFLKPLPMVAGLDASEFSESVLPTLNETAIYDNSPGGIGGIRTLCDESSEGLYLSGDYSAQLLNSLSCQMDCSWSCKACLHTGTCGWLNRQLQREMLRSIINERLRDIYFSA
jgi:hypothetical protein